MSKEGSELYDPEVAVAVMGNKAKAPAKMAEAAPAEKKTKARVGSLSFAHASANLTTRNPAGLAKEPCDPSSTYFF